MPEILGTIIMERLSILVIQVQIEDKPKLFMTTTMQFINANSLRIPPEGVKV